MRVNGAVLSQSAKASAPSPSRLLCAVKLSGASRARRGAGAKRPVITRRIAWAELDGSLFSDESDQAGFMMKEKHASQSDEPRYARTASRACEITPPCPRSNRMFSGTVSAPCRCMNIQSQTVRPNSSLQPTRNGMALGPCTAFNYDAPHGPSAMPLRAAELER